MERWWWLSHVWWYVWVVGLWRHVAIWYGCHSVHVVVRWHGVVRIIGVVLHPWWWGARWWTWGRPPAWRATANDW